MKSLSVVLILCLIASLTLLHCSKGTEPERLNTKGHEELGGYWEDVLDGRMRVHEVAWRFLSHKEEEGKIVVTVSYNLTFTNATSKTVTIKYYLHFYDREDFLIAEGGRLESDWVWGFSVEPNRSRERPGTVEIDVANVGVANSITTMKVWASFKEVE